MSSSKIHQQAIAHRDIGRGASMGVISGPAYHYGRWSGGGNPQSSTNRVRGRVTITDMSRVRREGNELRISVPTQSGEPCEVRVVNVGGFSMFYVCCGGHCAPMPIVFDPNPGNARPRRPSSYATVSAQGANCWTGIGHNNIVTLCCDVGDDTHCIPMPITFGPLPNASGHEITHQTLRHGNPSMQAPSGGPSQAHISTNLFTLPDGRLCMLGPDGEWRCFERSQIPTQRMPLLQPVRNNNPGQHAIGDEWWEYSADLTNAPYGAGDIRAAILFYAPGSYQLAAVGDVKYHRFPDPNFGHVDIPVRAKMSGQIGGKWYNCTFAADSNGAVVGDWYYVSCVEQPSVPGGAVQFQHPGFGYTLGQPIVDWSRRPPRLRARTYRNPMFAATTPSGPTAASDCSNPNTPASACKWICLPMPSPNDPHDEHCVRVPKAAQLRGAFFTSAPDVAPTIRERIAARYRGW